MITQNIRRGFLNYFKNKQHALIASSPVVPHDDPTLLFTNAGMNQFKDVFLGKTTRDYKRAATSQKCIRVGGKHNDLENVGHTSRHLTFFEMIGNFSFGDYFKKDAIQFAYEVSTEVFGLDPDRIWPTVFREDDEAFELWKAYVPESRITRFDEKDNFWAMGDTGPCGPCSELLYDRGEKFGSAKRPSEDLSGERYLEFWNLVFMQFNRQIDGTALALPKPSIDTGAGLERIVSLKMGVDNVFETDVLKSLIEEIERISNVRYESHDNGQSAAFRVIADHMRCLSFAISDGVQPSNVDRGYVLRKVLRRAVRYGRILGLEDPFLAKLLPRFIDVMGSDYPELKMGASRISEILTLEEEAFIRTLKRGGNLLNSIIDKAKSQKQVVSGDDAFKLKDTYGFPLEEITLLAKDADLTVDIEKYKVLEEEAKIRSRNVHKSTHQIASENYYQDFTEKNGTTEFLGYTENQVEATVKGLIVDGSFVESLQEGLDAFVILDKTPFYPEMGGQVGDSGDLTKENTLFAVTSTQSPYKGLIVHSGKLEKGTINIGDRLCAKIDSDRRQKIANNHTATHLLHFALHQILGEHIKQAGSVVEPSRLRFDFSHHKALTPEEISSIEDLVNAKIRQNAPVKNYELSYEEAQKRNDVKQFFGEKYGSTVRVIDIDYSKELCGGTHTTAVGTIGFFRIAKESSIAAGVRRIEAVTGFEAESFSRKSETMINDMAALLKAQPGKLMERLEKLLEENKELQSQFKAQRQNQLIDIAKELIQKAEKINESHLIAAELEVSPEDLRIIADHVMENKASTVLVLAAKNLDKCQMIVRVSQDLVAKGKKAIDLIKILSPIVEGSGGGKADSAQAGGKAPHKISEALIKAKELM